MRVVAKIRHDEGHGRQGREVGRPRGICFVVSCIGSCCPVRQRIVLARVVATIGTPGAACETFTRHRLVVAGNRKAGSQQLCAQRPGGKCVRTAVVGYALVGPAPQLVVVGLAGVADRKRLRERSVLLGKGIDIWRGRTPDDLFVRVVLHDRDHDMIGSRRGSGSWDCHP